MIITITTTATPRAAEASGPWTCAPDGSGAGVSCCCVCI